MNKSRGTSSVSTKDTPKQHVDSDKTSPADFANLVLELVQRAREAFDAAVAQASADFDRELRRITEDVRRVTAERQVEDTEASR